MKKIKHIQLLFIYAVMALAFAGCKKDSVTNNNNNNTNNNNNNGNNTGDTTKVTPLATYVVDPAGSYSSASGTTAEVIRVQKDGKILVLGYKWFVRLEQDGATIDNTFKPLTELAASADVKSLELQDDGKILVFGKFVLSNGRKAIVRLNTDGSIDETFNNPVLDINVHEQAVDIKAVKPLANGKMVIAGAFSYYKNNKPSDGAWAGIARLNADQSLDYGFTSPVSLNDAYDVEQMLPMADGSFLISGYDALGLNDGFNHSIVKINADGVPDQAYNFYPGQNVSVLVEAMIELAGGKVMMAYSDQYNNNIVVQLTSNGSEDNASQVYGTGATITSLFILPDKSMFIGTNPSPPSYPWYLIRLASAAIGTNGAHSTTYDDEFTNAQVFCLTSIDDNTVLVGGNFTLNGKKYAVARLKKNP